MVGGGTFGKLGIVAALSFSNAPQRQMELQRYFRQGGDGPIVFTEYKDFQDYGQQARLGAVLNMAYRLTPNQKLLFRNTFTHDSEKNARLFRGYDGGLDSNIESERIRFIERGLFSTSLEGDHSMPSLHNSVFKWQMTFSRSNRDEPDLREVIRGLLPNGDYTFAALSSSGLRFFSNLQDRIYEPQADFSVPFFKGSVSGLFKVGFRATLRERDFAARRFRYIPQQSTTLNLLLPSNQLFAPENIRPTGFQIVEFTRGTDSYTAEMNTYGGYAMVDLGLGPKWRIVGGIRVEDSETLVNTVDSQVPNAVPQVAALKNTDPVPAVNVIYALNAKANLRTSYSRTLSRPDFRELSPFDFNNVLGGFVVTGNPLLKRSSIDNFDFRYESFPGGNQVVAASFFYKKFTDPIESIVLPSNDLRLTFVNAKAANNYGLELEFRKELRAYSPKLKDLAISANFTFVESNITIRPEDAGVVTSQSRPLLGQSRYIFNVITEWRKPTLHSNARFYVNRVARRISDVGTFRLPDIYQEGNLFVDFVYDYTFTETSKWALRFEGENLADNHYRWTQGGLTQRDYQLGRTFQVGLTYRFF